MSNNRIITPILTIPAALYKDILKMESIKNKNLHYRSMAEWQTLSKHVTEELAGICLNNSVRGSGCFDRSVPRIAKIETRTFVRLCPAPKRPPVLYDTITSIHFDGMVDPNMRWNVRVVPATRARK